MLNVLCYYIFFNNSYFINPPTAFIRTSFFLLLKSFINFWGIFRLQDSTLASL